MNVETQKNFMQHACACLLLRLLSDFLDFLHKPTPRTHNPELPEPLQVLQRLLPRQLGLEDDPGNLGHFLISPLQQSGASGDAAFVGRQEFMDTDMGPMVYMSNGLPLQATELRPARWEKPPTPLQPAKGKATKGKQPGPPTAAAQEALKKAAEEKLNEWNVSSDRELSASTAPIHMDKMCALNIMTDAPGDAVLQQDAPPSMLPLTHQ